MDPAGRLSRSKPLSEEDLGRLYREASADRAEIRFLLNDAKRARTTLRRGLNRRIAVETAFVVSVREKTFEIETRDFEPAHARQVFLSLDRRGETIVLPCRFIREPSGDRVELSIPARIYVDERRDSSRRKSTAPRQRVQIQPGRGEGSTGFVSDWSDGGLAVEVPAGQEFSPEDQVEIRFLDERRATQYGQVRHLSRREQPGWTRLGLQVSTVPSTGNLEIHEYSRVFPKAFHERAQERVQVLGGAARVAVRRAASRVRASAASETPVPLRDFTNNSGERIRAIVDTWGDVRHGTAVIIPPAFGKTKETLLPLALTIVESFKRARRPVAVVRFDGVRRRGESHNDPECLAPGREYLHFTGSQAVDDIRATLRFLQEAPDLRPSKTVLVTFSAASSEGRKVLATDSARQIDGWVCVVGAPDTQSAMKKISGGIDFTRGLLSGVRFGKQEILGVVMDADRTGLDGIEAGLATYEDARRDMASIAAPITWIHGKHDAWMDRRRVEALMRCGDSSNRKLIEVPTGHQLRTSQQALEIFQLISSEIAEMSGGDGIRPALPSMTSLDSRHLAERSRLPKVRIDLREMWREYLLGPDGIIGIELMTASEIYRAFMRQQIRQLRLQPHDRVIDLGAGTGAFRRMLEVEGLAGPVAIHELDFVGEALSQGRRDTAGRSVGAASLVADLEVGSGLHIPIRDGSYDAVIASLVVSYVEDPVALAGECARILRPGGRIVLSSLVPDADISKVFEDGIDELSEVDVAEVYGDAVAARDAGELSREFLNRGARILELEEQGRFRFWTGDALADLLESCGFGELQIVEGFGNPPQAVIVSATLKG